MLRDIYNLPDMEYKKFNQKVHILHLNKPLEMLKLKDIKNQLGKLSKQYSQPVSMCQMNRLLVRRRLMCTLILLDISYK